MKKKKKTAKTILVYLLTNDKKSHFSFAHAFHLEKDLLYLDVIGIFTVFCIHFFYYIPYFIKTTTPKLLQNYSNCKHVTMFLLIFMTELR